MRDHTLRSGLTRRRLLELATASLVGDLGARALSPVDAAARPAIAVSGRARWPTATLHARDAQRVNLAQFMPAGQLTEWHRQLDAVGLRATGSPAQERFIDVLSSRLARAGVRQLRFEAVPHRRWLAQSWSLHAGTGAASQAIPTASYIPYSGGTPLGGVSGPLVFLDNPEDAPPAAGSLRGKIALFALPLTSLTYGALGTFAYKSYDPARLLKPDGVYARSWLSIATLITILTALVDAGAAGCICILDLPADAAHGAYYPYDGTIRSVPGLFVDRQIGARLKALATAGGASARLTLRSQTRQVKPAT